MTRLPRRAHCVLVHDSRCNTRSCGIQSRPEVWLSLCVPGYLLMRRSWAVLEIVASIAQDDCVPRDCSCSRHRMIETSGTSSRARFCRLPQNPTIAVGAKKRQADNCSSTLTLLVSFQFFASPHQVLVYLLVSRCARHTLLFESEWRRARQRIF